MHWASSQNIDKRFATLKSSRDCDSIGDACVCKCTLGPSAAEPLKVNKMNKHWILDCVSFSKISFSVCLKAIMRRVNRNPDSPQSDSNA